MLRCTFNKFILATLNVYKRSYSLFRSDCGTPAVPCTKTAVLSNGVRVATEESNSIVACVALFVEAGPVYENHTNNGITHFIEHLAYGGFKSMNQHQLEEYLASIGAEMSVLTTREYQVFSAKCLTACVPDMINILSKIVTELDLTRNAIEQAKWSLEAESFDADNNPKLVVSDFLHETAFQCTPLGQRVIGPSKNIKTFNKHIIECYMKEFYSSNRLVLATSGAVNHDCIVSCAESCFGKMDSPCGVDYSPVQRFTGSQIAYRDDSMPLVHVAIAVEAPGFRGSDFLMMFLASHIIGSWSKNQGGTDRHASPLARAAATSSLCDSFESFYIPYRDVGLWGIYMVTELMTIDDMITNVQDRWMHLCSTTLYNDVERALNTTKLEIAKRIEGSVKSCNDIGTQIIYNCERRSLLDIYDALSRANEKTLKQVVAQYLYDKCPAVAAVGPAEALPDYTRTRAGMYWLRL